ncbi:hypothetical protein M404DRAFT_28121 [Pisolithus tinctorius Marx 270]|uniref:Uncharacterized protein n=1 Tax=Pisolithus tinctorius Marx 270 TaxID=870435 RepID=A0A0C3NMV5_PISTI|nr:hypothetical protein M404DRAFT_28121 [Pisolithus tinctorius Marx 270]
MAGQEGLIDIAVKTGGKGMSNDVCYDGTVCNLLGDLIQLIYREDGMHGSWSRHPDPTSASTKDSAFVKSFFAIPGDGGSAKMEMEWVLETDGVNLKAVICIPGVDFTLFT